MNIQIPLSNGEIINFSFKPQDLPHLIGLQYLVDIQVLFEYSEKRLSATELYSRMCKEGDGAINPDEFEDSAYFEDLYNNRIKYFTSERILEIIDSKQIVKFDAAKIKNFSTKLEGIEYFFWKRYKDEDGRFGYFGIGFMASGKESDVNFPNTFFFRSDDEYIAKQTVVFPYSIMKKDKFGVKIFHIYWEQVWQGLSKNVHYRYLSRQYEQEGKLLFDEIVESKYPEVLKHYDLLQLDALDKIYLPYMKKGFRWTNEEKRYILQNKKIYDQAIYPNEIVQLINEYRQRN